MASTRPALQLFADRLAARSTLSGVEIDAILNLRGEAAQARAYRDIVSPGQTTDRASLIVDGLVGRFGQISDGRRQITALHIAGDMCDLHSVVSPVVGWSLQALATTTILRIPHAELLKVARTYPAIAEAFWRDCVVDASILSQWVVNVGRRNALMRLAHLLCEHGLRLEDVGLGNRKEFRLNATQAQLADALGLTSVHVNRTFQTLKAAGVVVAVGRTIRVNDWDRLASIGEFDGAYLQTRKWLAANDKSPGPQTLAS